MKQFILLFVTIWTLISPAHEIKAQWVNTSGPSDLTALAVTPNGTGETNLFAGTISRGVFRSTDNGTSWTAGGLTNTYIVSCLTVSGTNLFAGTISRGVFLSTNNGASWTAVFTGVHYPGGVTFVPEVHAFAVSPNGTGGTNLFAGTNNGVFLSTDNGTSWTQVNTGLTDPFVIAFAVIGTNLFAGTYQGGVFLSTNNGTSWTAANTGLMTADYGYLPQVRAFAVVPDGIGGTNLFAGTERGVFLSSRRPITWTPVNTGLPTNAGVGSLAVSGTNLFAAAGGGVFLSTNNGTSWSQTGLPTNAGVGSLAVSGTTLFAGTFTGGVWRRPLSEMITGVKEVCTSLPEGYALQQNYPNPFNPSTAIRFSLPKSGYVTLKVYDLLGREVETLVDGQRTAGSYGVEWRPNNLASGVYFYRLQAGAFSDVKKLVLVK